MPAEVLTAAIAVMGVMILAISTQWRRARQSAVLSQLLQSGTLTTGTVVAINRPFGERRETCVYFSYAVPGRGTVVQGCCLDLLALREQHAVSIPGVGSTVAVRYLPQSPQVAVLPQLAPCLAGLHTPSVRSAS